MLTSTMNLAADISLYPLTETYIPPIDSIIARFESYPDIEVRRNDLSTQLFGEYETLMKILHTEMAKTFAENRAAIVVKFVCIDSK